MIKKNVKILLAYILGVLVSLFLTVPLSPFLGNFPVIFSVITTFITLAFMYSEMWKCGKYDALRKENSVLKAFGYMGFFIIISVIVELIAILHTSTGRFDIPEFISVMWFYPFTGFFNYKSYIPPTLIIVLVVLIIIAMAIIAYYMGVAGVSVSDKILTARKKRIDAKAEKHFEEIEKIKEQYRKK